MEKRITGIGVSPGIAIGYGKKNNWYWGISRYSNR